MGEAYLTGIGEGSIATEHSKRIACTTDFWGPIQIKGEQAPPIIYGTLHNIFGMHSIISIRQLAIDPDLDRKLHA